MKSKIVKEFEELQSSQPEKLPPIITLSPLHNEFADSETGLNRLIAVDKYQTESFIILNYYKPISRFINIRTHEK